LSLIHYFVSLVSLLLFIVIVNSETQTTEGTYNMAFPTKVIPLSDAFKQWLNATFAPKVHKHTMSDITGLNPIGGSIYIVDEGDISNSNENTTMKVYRGDGTLLSTNITGHWIQYSNDLIDQWFELPPNDYGHYDGAIYPKSKVVFSKPFKTTSYSIYMQVFRADANAADGHGYVEVKYRYTTHFTFDTAALANSCYMVRMIGF